MKNLKTREDFIKVIAESFSEELNNSLLENQVEISVDADGEELKQVQSEIEATGAKIIDVTPFSVVIATATPEEIKSIQKISSVTNILKPKKSDKND